MNSYVTTVLAVWGALLSTFTLGWSLRRDLRDRAKVKLVGTIGQVVRDQIGRTFFANMRFLESHLANRNPSVPTQFKLTITNVGRRRVRIEGWGGKRRRIRFLNFWEEKKQFRHDSLGLPKLLEEGESHEELSPDLAMILSDSVSRIFAWDSTGKRWKLSRWQLRNLKREFHSLEKAGKL